MFSHSFRLGKILGIEIEIDYTWFIILGLMAFGFARGLPQQLELKGLHPAYYWLLGIAIALLLFASVLIHELSHSLLAKMNGLGIAGITLFLFGGVSKLVKEPRSALSELQISIVGPLVSLLLAGLFAIAHWLAVGPVLKTIFGVMAFINALLAVFNLLPGLPLDGGRVLRAIIWYVSGSFAKATRIAAIAGQGIGFFLILIGVMTLFRNFVSGLWMAFIGWFLIQAAQGSYQQSILRRLLSGVKVNSVMTSDVVTVAAEMTLEELVNDYFLVYNYAAFPVLRDGEVVGLIHLSDARKIPRERWISTAVGELVAPLRDQQVIAPEEDAWEAMAKMASEGTGRLLVMSEGVLHGIISRANVMRLIRTKMDLGA
ncbi:MAG: CBS domain-containing protein [Armatimonadetes bacterium]|nr:CBS domain-containing protein [Armatimonadota bacterium]NIM24721.1 CBS domain-containing protein [Armatimonadota bacterium]NIM68601.1 CBS domain-containing protein [Armatimonadota bacterium]NIM77118.1 CBS domain-containing protein [Armatimonadota bacterium]NIN06795.1 CBS domain-containing protein [Armatimonadota bacterium]